MQQAEMASLINTVIKNQQNQYPAQNLQTAQMLQEQQTNTNSAAASNKKSQNKMLNAVKEIGITAGMGIAGGATVGAVASLIPTQNTDRISNVLCDTFIKAADPVENSDIVKKLNINLNNADKQIQKAKEYINIAKIFDDAKSGTEPAETAYKNLSDAAWALKQSAVEYIEQAAKDDGLLKFAKKEAKKMRTSELMANSIKTGITAAFMVLLFNMISGMFGKKSSKDDAQK